MKKSMGYTPEELTQSMIFTNQMHLRMVERDLVKTGVHRAQHRILMVIASHEFCSQVELAKHLEVTPATIAISLKAMERDGLILRNKKTDGRVNFVELTLKGKKIAEESRSYFSYVNEKMYEGFSEEDRKKLCGYLERIYENMQNIPDNGFLFQNTVLNKKQEEQE